MTLYLFSLFLLRISILFNLGIKQLHVQFYILFNEHTFRLISIINVIFISTLTLENLFNLLYIT